MEIDGSRSIDLYTCASIVSDPPACDIRAYLVIDTLTRWQICDNANRSGNVNVGLSEKIIQTSAGEKISCSAIIMSTHLVGDIVCHSLLCPTRDTIAFTYVCMCAGGCVAHRGATNSYLKLYRTRLVPRATISRFTETILHPESPPLTPSLSRSWRVPTSRVQAPRVRTRYKYQRSSHLDKYFAQVPFV